MTNEKAYIEITKMISTGTFDPFEDSRSALELARESLKKQEKYGWHDLRKDKDDLPEDLEILNVTWVNHKPAPYYADIKDKPFSDASAVLFRGKWFWWSELTIDYLREYGDSYTNGKVDEDVEIIAWKRIDPFGE